MDILILDSWLREHLKTNATTTNIAKYLTLCGPSIEKVDKVSVNGKADYLYHVEITTNRVDMMSVRGIAREASVILPEFGYKAELINLDIDKKAESVKTDIGLKLKANPKLIDRLMGVILEIDSVDKSPDFIKDRLESTGIRSLNAIVDITNYVMTEIGQPTHVFDYDLVKPFMGIREAKKSESVTSFDGKSYKLPGGDIVIENEKGEIIDLPGIIGTKNSVVNKNTKRILFFIDENDPVKLRRTSMTLGIRTAAVTLNEKSVDPELATVALKRGLLLFKKVAGAKQISKIYDVYPNKPKIVSINVSHDFIEKRLGVEIESKKIVRILTKLGMSVRTKKTDRTYSITPPSYRAKDIKIPEDIVEEVARIYGYHNLPSRLMTGEIPESNYDSPFEFEKKLKIFLSGFGGSEVYTLSLISENEIIGKNLKLKNPLGKDTEFLRKSLKNSLINAAKENIGHKEPFHLFELANRYFPNKGKLPEEIMTISGIFSNYSYRQAKGIIEALLTKLKIEYQIVAEDFDDFIPAKSIKIYHGKILLGIFGEIKESYIYYEFGSEILRKFHKYYSKFVNIPKFPPQIEDITLILPEKTKVQEIIDFVKNQNKKINLVTLTDIYKNSYTFRVLYQDPAKTLSNDEVEKIRNTYLKSLKSKFGITSK